MKNNPVTDCKIHLLVVVDSRQEFCDEIVILLTRFLENDEKWPRNRFIFHYKEGISGFVITVTLIPLLP